MGVPAGPLGDIIRAGGFDGPRTGDLDLVRIGDGAGLRSTFAELVRSRAILSSEVIDGTLLRAPTLPIAGCLDDAEGLRFAVELLWRRGVSGLNRCFASAVDGDDIGIGGTGG